MFSNSKNQGFDISLQTKGKTCHLTFKRVLKKVLICAVVSSKGQVVIPSSLRKAMGIHTGTELIFVIHDDVLEARPVKRSIELFFGCCKQKGESTLSVPEIDKAIQKAVEDEDSKTLDEQGLIMTC